MSPFLDNNSVSVIDGENNTKIDDIPVGTSGDIDVISVIRHNLCLQ